MFKAIRKVQNGKQIAETVKEFETVVKAVAYARRYAKGNRFIECSVFDADDDVVFTIFAGGEEKCFPALHGIKNEVKTEAQEVQLTEESNEEAQLVTDEEKTFVQTLLDLPDEETIKGDITATMHFKNGTKKIGFCNKQAAMTYAFMVIKKAGTLLESIVIGHGKVIHWIWQGGWLCRKSREPCLIRGKAV